MRFDKFDPAFEQAEELLPDGVHECEIVKVKRWEAKDGSRTALIVTLQDVGDAYAPVEKWLNPEEKRDHRTAMQLADAVGLARDAEFTDEIEGRRVLVTTARGIKKSTGDAVVYVNAFAAAAVPAWEQEKPAAKPAAKRTPTQKADAASGASGDDIPFAWLLPFVVGLAAQVIA